MSLISGRAALFLEEMGVGPLWHLRQGSAMPEEQPLAAPAAQEGQGIAASEALPALAGRPAEAAPNEASNEAATAWFDEVPMSASAVSDRAIGAMGWAELKAAAARCTRCDLCRGRKGTVFGRGDQNADWLIVGGGPNRADEKDGRAITGEAGKLLDNMLLALGLEPERHVYVTNLVKCRPPGAGAAPAQVAACRPYLERELALTGGRIIVAIGQAAASGLPGATDASRGAVRRLGAIAVVVTHHPEDLLRQGENKAEAWADLCLAKSAHAEPD